jgi:hypothetical protein
MQRGPAAVVHVITSPDIDLFDRPTISSTHS